MSPYRLISTYVRDRSETLFAYLKELVLTQSGSLNKAGVDRVGQLIGGYLSDLPLSIETVKQDSAGNHLVARTKPAAAGRKGILLVGHMDTVFGEDTQFNWYRQDSQHCYGPGVIDMKGGLVVGIAALEALHHNGILEDLPITLIFNSDEEIGSITSRDLIQQHAGNNLCAFVMECAGPNGEVVTGRKGNLSATLDVHGEAGHAAFAAKDKASAILALARMIVAIEALNEPGRGVTTNVGVITGGTAPNTVAEHASARIDARFTAASDYSRVCRELQTIAAATPVAGVDARLTIRTSRPPMPATEQNKGLFKVVRDTARLLGMTIAEELRQGVSDANTIAQAGIPVLDGLGPAGARDHSDKEYMVAQSLIDRTILLAAAIEASWNHYTAKD